MSTISQNIRLLGDLLGQIIVEQAGSSVFDLEEKIRGLSKQWRDGDMAAQAEVVEKIAGISDGLDLTGDILKSFSTYFQLVNLAEEHERISILQDRNNQAFQMEKPMDESIHEAIATLKSEGFTAQEIQAMLEQMLIMPVFTAHPTESRRRTIRQILSHISDQLTKIEQSPEYRVPQIQQELARYVTLLWQSDESRKRRPTVMDEVRNTGLYFFENTLFDVVPVIYEELENALAAEFPEFEWQTPPVLRFGSWIGGDRDGNPFVTKSTTEAAIRTQQDTVLERYAQDVYELYELLSPATDRVGFDQELMSQLENEIAQLPQQELETVQRFHQEPYRQKLILVYRRIQATLRQNKQPWIGKQLDQRAYQNADQLLQDLAQVRASLIDNRGQILAQGRLARLIRRVEVFGFHLASLDIRQHSGKHEQALAEIFERFQVCENYSERTEEERVQLLSRETENRRPLTAELVFSEETNEVVSLFRTIKIAHQNSGHQCIETYVISMTESVSDVLEVLLLMSDAGLIGKLNVVPLFETVDDLKAAPRIMTQLFANPVYRQHLAQRDNHQQIMIGYSDSNKDGGFFRANWMLYTAQRELAETCADHEIQLTLFHGRGGSIGRGGGPANRAILAQPPASVRGRIRITEQGEVVSSRYTHHEIAKRHLQQLFHAVLCSGGTRPHFPKYQRWADIVEQLSLIAYQKYRSLVENADFIEYFQTATPIDQIDQLNLGSRPSRRKQTQSINDLRAIPWVFAWTQSRTNIPSWYGVGTGISNWLNENGEQRVEELREMYQQWPFFKTMMQNVHVGMGRADMQIAKLYSELAPKKFGAEVFEGIRAEFELAKSQVLLVTGHQELLDTESWLKRSIRMRNPYVDPMNYIQIALLERYRNSDNPELREKIQRVLVQSINGIAGGLQNVG